MSAPGRRPEGTKTGPGGPQFTGPVEVTARGQQGHQLGAGHPPRMMLGGWSARDVLDRNAGELSRGGLLCLVRALREDLGATATAAAAAAGDDGHSQGRGPANHGARQIGANTNRGPEVSEEGVGVSGRPDAQTLLREQTRRYNDLRVAYASLCRRLEKKGQRGAGFSCRIAGVGQAGQAKVAPARRGNREIGANTQVACAKPETNVGGGRRIGSTA